MKNCIFMSQKWKKRVTYLQEARPPIDKDIPEDSPIVFEKAIKNQMPQRSESRGDISGGSGSFGTQQSFVQEWGRGGICLHHPAADPQLCIAGKGPCSKAGGCSQLIFLQIQSC